MYLMLHRILLPVVIERFIYDIQTVVFRKSKALSTDRRIVYVYRNICRFHRVQWHFLESIYHVYRHFFTMDRLLLLLYAVIYGGNIALFSSVCFNTSGEKQQKSKIFVKLILRFAQRVTQGHSLKEMTLLEILS